MNLNNFFEIVIYAILAIFGVTAKELNKNFKNLEITSLISSMVASAFGATIIYLAASMANIPPQAGYLLAGLVGWSGPQIIDKIFSKYSGMLGDVDK